MDLTIAKQVAAEIAASLVVYGAKKGQTPLRDVFEDYLSSGEGRNQKQQGRDWGETQLTQVRGRMMKAIDGMPEAQVLARDVDRTVLDQLRSRAGTRTTRKELTTNLRGLLRWGYTNQYFTPEQAELLPTNLMDIAGEVQGNAAPPRRRRTRHVGAASCYIGQEDAPSVPLILALAGQFELAQPAWGRLDVELAGACGARWAEQHQLTADDVVPVTLRDGTLAWQLRILWQINAGAKRSEPGALLRIPPKGDKVRDTPVPTESITGYPLLPELLARVAAARAEQAAGTNPEALLFPTATGKLWHGTGFHSDVFKPCAIAAGWPHQVWQQTYERHDKKTGERTIVTRPVTTFDLTWHSLRHRFARTAVDVDRLTAGELMMVGGWENLTVVQERYYKSGQEHLQSAHERIARRAQHTSSVSVAADVLLPEQRHMVAL